MADTKDDPTFVVKLTGILSQEDLEQYARGLQKVLPGRVIVTDNRVEDVREVTGMQPRDAMVTIHHEQVPAKVWPVAMGENELLVEWEDGTLDTARLRDIRMGVIEND